MNSIFLVDPMLFKVQTHKSDKRTDNKGMRGGLAQINIKNVWWFRLDMSQLVRAV